VEFGRAGGFFEASRFIDAPEEDARFRRDYGIRVIRARGMRGERVAGGGKSRSGRETGNGAGGGGGGGGGGIRQQDGEAKTFAVSRERPTKVLRRNYVNRNRQTPVRGGSQSALTHVRTYHLAYP